MKTYKKYTIFQSYKVVALKLSLPCPFESQNSKGRGRHNFWATTLKLWKNEYFLRVFKSYYYHFFIFLLDSDLEKTLLSQTSIAWGVLEQTFQNNVTCNHNILKFAVVFPLCNGQRQTKVVSRGLKFELLRAKGKGGFMDSAKK